MYLTLDEVRQVTAQVTKGAKDLELSHAAKIYLPKLRNIEKKLDAAAGELTIVIASDADLTGFDANHDGYAKATWHLCEAYLQAPDTSDEVRAAVLEIRGELVPDADVWTTTFASEAQRAKDAKAKLPKLSAELAMLPLANGGDVGRWATHYVKAGIQLGEGLASRAVATQQAKQAKPADGQLVRAQLLKTLGDFRTALLNEAEDNPDLMAVAGKVFALYDELSQSRQSAARAANKRKAKGEEAAAPTAAPGAAASADAPTDG